jgi:signal transduction histidine kinase
MPQCASAQGMPLLDSLRRSVQQAPNDTARISALCRLSDALCIVDGKDSLGRIQANVALHLAERLSGGKYEPFAAYYRALTLQTLGVTYRFASEGKNLLAEPYFRAALEEARRIPEEVRSLQMQASVQHAWFTGLRFRIHGHRKDDKPIIELYNQAERLLEAQQAIAEKLSSNALRGQIALNRAIVLTDTLAQRLLLCLESVRFYEQSPDIDGLERSLNYLGFYAEQIGDYPRVVQAYKRVVRLHDSVEIEPRGLAVAYQAMGDIYAKLSDTTKALENYHRAEPYSERYDVRFNRIELLFQIGTLYRAIGSPDKARTYFERAMVLSKERKEGYDLVRSAQLYRLQDNFRAALAVLAQSLREIGNLSPQTFSYDVLFEVALVHKEQAMAFKFTQPRLFRASLDSALHYAKKCLPLLLDERLKIGSADRFLKIYTLLYELSKEAGDSKNALLYHEERERWSNKTLSSETHRAIAAMESRAVVEAAEAKIETLEANNRLQRTVGWAVSVGVIGLMVIIGLLTWRYRERKRSSALLQQQNEQLTALNNEKSEIMGIVSHDLKNPISAVAGFAEILREPMIDEQNKLLILDQLSLVSNRMLELVKNVLDVYKIEEGALSVNITTIDIVPVCKMMVEMYREQASTKDITLNYTAEKESIVLADEQMLNQIIDNLLSNAVKYTPRGKQAWIRVLEKSSFVRVEIENEGEGISEEDMKRLFGKFARLSAQPTGGEHSTGLGLSIVKKMVEAMNGKVWCESDVGKGATFIVELPQIL